MQYAVVFFAFSIQSMWSLSSQIKRRFLNKGLSDFNLALDLGFLTKAHNNTFFKPQFIFYAHYLSEKIGYCRYITVYRDLETNPWIPMLPILAPVLKVLWELVPRWEPRWRLLSLHFWRPSLSFSTIGRPNCGRDCTASLHCNVSVLTTILFPLGFVPVIQNPSHPVSVMLQSKFLMWICLQISVFLHICHMIGPSHA